MSGIPSVGGVSAPSSPAPGRSLRVEGSSKLAKIASKASRALRSITSRFRAQTPPPMPSASRSERVDLSQCSDSSPVPSPVLSPTPVSMRENLEAPPANIYMPPSDPSLSGSNQPADEDVERNSNTASSLGSSDFDLPRIVTWEDDFNALCEEMFPEGGPLFMADQAELSAGIEDKILNLMKERCDIHAKDPQDIGSDRTKRNAKKMSVIMLNAKDSKLNAARRVALEAGEKSFSDGAPRHRFDLSKVKKVAHDPLQAPFQDAVLDPLLDLHSDPIQTRFETVQPFFDIVLPDKPQNSKLKPKN